jgi:hypothetical protein
VLQKYGLDCPCVKSSPTHVIRESLGINLVLSPLGLLKTRYEEWNKCYSNSVGEITHASNPLQMAPVLGHRSARVADGHSITADKICPMKCGETPLGDDEAPLCTAQLPNGRVTCVTTPQSFDLQVLQKFRRQMTYTWQPEGESRKNKKGETYTTRPRERSRVIPYTALSVESVWRDEAHLERLETSATIAVLRSSFFKLPQNRSVHHNIMSGTLLTTGPTDIAHYISRMTRRGWVDHPVLRGWMNGEAIELGIAWDKLVRTGYVKKEASPMIIEQFKPLIETNVFVSPPTRTFLAQGLW